MRGKRRDESKKVGWNLSSEFWGFVNFLEGVKI